MRKPSRLTVWIFSGALLTPSQLLGQEREATKDLRALLSQTPPQTTEADRERERTRRRGNNMFWGGLIAVGAGAALIAAGLAAPGEDEFGFERDFHPLLLNAGLISAGGGTALMILGARTKSNASIKTVPGGLEVRYTFRW